MMKRGLSTCCLGLLASLTLACTQEALTETLDAGSGTGTASGGPGAVGGEDASVAGSSSSDPGAPSSSASLAVVSSSTQGSSAALSQGATSTGSSGLPDAGAGTPDAGGVTPFKRFVALGDTGTGSTTQMKVAAAMGTVCVARGGCDFGLLLGDNFYNSGVDGVEDEKFNSMFVVPYGPLGFTFYPALGNHDYGGEGAGVEPYKGARQVDYSAVNPQWVMPATFYQQDEAPVWLLGLNTTAVFWGLDGDQRDTVPGWIAAAPAGSWKIAFGHHPYLSNGDHGNAGEYEGLPDWIPWASGQEVKEFTEDILCGHVDAYLCGHDHSRQDLGEVCGTQFIVSGAGAKTTDLPGEGPNAFQAATPGFLMVEATPQSLRFMFFDEDGVMDHERTLTRP